MKSWWLSFADGSLPKGKQFLGACIVEAHDFIGAVRAAHALGINPGGEVQGVLLPESFQVQAGWRERLMDRATCEAFDQVHRRRP